MANRSMLLFLLIAVTSLAPAQSTGSNQFRPALELTVKTDHQVYRMSEEMRMESQLLNTSSGDVYVWGWDLCWNPSKGLSMHIGASDGSAIHGELLLDCVPPPPRDGEVYDFIKLEPQTFHGRVDKFKIADLVKKPGEYDIEVTFNSFISDTFVEKHLSRDPLSKLPLWTMEMPTVAARRIHVTVKP